jgi:hypothetical protein
MQSNVQVKVTKLSPMQEEALQSAKKHTPQLTKIQRAIRVYLAKCEVARLRN